MLELEIASVTVNHKTCIGCARCASAVPEVFRIKKGKSSVRDQADLSLVDYIKGAERNCPTHSIKVHDTAP